MSDCGNKCLSPKFLMISGIVCCSVLMVEGFLCFSTCVFNIRSLILSFYYITFGMMTIAAELKFKIIMKSIAILHTNIGRGFWYFFLGTLALGGEWWAIVTALCLLLLGGLNICAGCRKKSIG